MWRLAEGTAIGLVLALALGLRIWRLDLVQFGLDEAEALQQAEDMVRLGRVALAGLPSSLGGQLGPYLIYFLAPIVAVSRDPAVASGAIGVVNALGVGGVMLLGRRSLSPLGGLVAGLAYATNPWAVFFARKVWAPDLVAPWAVLFFIALDGAVVMSRMEWAMATLPIFSIGVQIHPAFVLLAPLLVGPIGLLLVRRRWVNLAISTGLTMVTALPYALYAFQTGWADLQPLLQNRLAQASVVDGTGLAYMLGFTLSWDNWYVLGIHLDRVLPGRIAALAANIQTALLMVGLGVAVVLSAAPRGGRPGQRPRFVGLLLWLTLPAVLTVRHAFPLYDHYFPLVMPAAALLLAAGVNWLVERPAPWRRPLLGITLAGVLVLAGTQTAIVGRLLGRVAVQAEPSYGPPLALTEALAQDLTSFGSSAASQHLIVEFWGSDSLAMAYLTRPSFPVQDVATLGQVGLGRTVAGTVSPLEAPSGTVALGPIEQLSLRYADGIELISAAQSSRLAPSERVGLALAWAARGSSNADVVWELTLFDPSGAQVARQATAGENLSTIATGQTNISWFTLETQPGAAEGPYQLRLRRLAHTTGQALPFDDALGQTASEWRSAPIDMLGREAR